MKKITSFSYDVKPNEPIIVEVTPVNFNDSFFSVNANRDGDDWEAETGSEDQPRFEFTVSKPVEDIHTAIFEFTFITGSPNNSFYDVVVKGENDQGCPCGFKVRKTTANKEPSIQFFVVA